MICYWRALQCIGVTVFKQFIDSLSYSQLWYYVINFFKCRKGFRILFGTRIFLVKSVCSCSLYFSIFNVKYNLCEHTRKWIICCTFVLVMTYELWSDSLLMMTESQTMKKIMWPFLINFEYSLTYLNCLSVSNWLTLYLRKVTNYYFIFMRNILKNNFTSLFTS